MPIIIKEGECIMETQTQIKQEEKLTNEGEQMESMQQRELPVVELIDACRYCMGTAIKRYNYTKMRSAVVCGYCEGTGRMDMEHDKSTPIRTEGVSYVFLKDFHTPMVFGEPFEIATWKFDMRSYGIPYQEFLNGKRPEKTIPEEFWEEVKEATKAWCESLL